jgi:hypothetical protein
MTVIGATSPFTMASAKVGSPPDPAVRDSAYERQLRVKLGHPMLDRE